MFSVTALGGAGSGDSAFSWLGYHIFPSVMVPLYSFVLVEIRLESQASQGWSKWWWLENPFCRGQRHPSIDKGAGLGCCRETAELLDCYLSVVHPCVLPLQLILLWAEGWARDLPRSFALFCDAVIIWVTITACTHTLPHLQGNLM